MNFRFICLAGIIALAFVGTAFAHHSHMYYVTDEEIVLGGTVKEFDWRNPHSWITVMVVDEASGEVQEWAFEARAPAQRTRRGWKSDSLAPGDEVSITFRPLTNGGKGGLLREVTLADGTVLLDR